MSGFGAEIRRGAMAGDHYTMISNALFRDSRLSFKAKGLFGLISTHRDGWRITVAELVKCSTDGQDAVLAGLKELETHGYLVRERARRENGTLGEAVYTITDVPAHHDDPVSEAAPVGPAPQHCRSQPMTENPAQEHPAQADPAPKKTKPKKTNKQNTNPVHPSVRTAPARDNDHALASTQAPAAPDPVEATPGVQLLLGVGMRDPDLLLTGPALREQGQIATALLENGWQPDQLVHLIAGRPLPRPIRKSVAAIIAARLRAAQNTPLPQPLDLAPSQPTGSAVADLTPAEALARRALVECAGCGNPGPAPGEDLCPTCLNWPPCTTCTGPTPRRAHPESDGRCTACVLAAELPQEPTGPSSS
ncbi:hypothetical protein ACFYZ9_38425 [Streptomyces sp. NPDC001691]|uniref:hypothetical protein n=1 Tax=Streptomyces sp. NPDC001691 TaxID=3364600 RepID=UPI0036AB7CC3